MRLFHALLLSSALLAPASASFALDMDSLKKSAQEAVASDSDVTGKAGELVSSLAKSMNISQEQATGGSAALLAYATNQLSSSQLDDVKKQIPGLQSLLGGEDNSLTGTVLNNISSMDGVNKIFSSLGLEPDMVSQFIPAILSFLNEQNIDESILATLKKAWA